MSDEHARGSDDSVVDAALWPIQKVAAYWGMSQSRAYALLADRGIRRVSGYPADLVRAVRRRQGARTDLADTTAPNPADLAFGPIQAAAISCLIDSTAWTPTRIAVTIDGSKESESANAATRTLISAGLRLLEERGYAERTYGDGWRITDAGRHAFDHSPETAAYRNPPPPQPDWTAPPMTENSSGSPDITDPNDLALLKALRTATFSGPVTLPSGLTLTPEQLRELTADS